MTLQPQASFTVVRQIANHLDVDTNYVRAVIRNAYTDEIIATLNLDNKGGQRFSKNWQVPADTSGQGFYISIVTSVYTDSGYTTKNENYGDEENTYLVQERVMLGHGGGGVDSFTVRRIIGEELDKRLESLSGVTGAVGALQREVNRIPKEDHSQEILSAIRTLPSQFPQPTEQVDLSPVLSAVQDAKAAIEAKEVTPPTDLAPVLEKLSEEAELTGDDLSEIKDLLDSLEATLTQTIEESVRDAMDTTEFVSSFSTRAQPAKKGKPEEKPFDTSKLSI